MGWKSNPFVPHGPAGPRPGQHPALVASARRLQKAVGNRRCLDVLVRVPEEPPPPPPVTVVDRTRPAVKGSDWMIWLAVFALLAALVSATAAPRQWIVWAALAAFGAVLFAFGLWGKRRRV